MSLQWAESGRFEHVVPDTVQHHITTSSGAGTLDGTCLASGEAPSAGRRVEQNLAYRFGMRREESAPAEVVPPASGRHALAMPPGQPHLHVCFGNPHPLLPSMLREYHDVGQDSILDPSSTRGGL